MGQSTDGQICYGVMFEEDYEFPWDDEKYDGDIEDWWRDLCGYKPTNEIYSNGGYVGGVKPPESVFQAYYEERRVFDKAHPIPFELVNYCSGDYPMYILAITRTCLSNSRGTPEAFNPESLTITEDEKSNLLDFCAKHGLSFEGEPSWWLSSYWG